MLMRRRGHDRVAGQDGSVGRKASVRRKGLGPIIAMVAAAAVALFAPPAAAQQTPAGQTIVLSGGMLVNGLSVPPLNDARVVIKGERVVAAGPASEIAIPAGATVIDTSGQTIMPGLIDAHAHLFMLGYGDEAAWFRWLAGPGKKYSIRQVMELSAWQLLMSGVTGAIDLGGTTEDSIAVRDRINRGEVPGPRLLVAGPLVTRRAFAGFPAEASAVISSPAEGAAVVDKLFKQGVDVIKAHAGLTREDYFAIVQAAHKNGIKVHAHLYDETAVRNAFDAGVDVYQHMGSAGYPTYDPELMRAMATSNRPVVLTAAHRSWIFPDTVSFPERLRDPVLKSMFPADMWKAVQDSFKEWPAEGYFAGIDRQIRFRSPQVKQLIESNLLMGVGTDSGTPMNFNTDGLVREMIVLADEGMAPLEVIADTTRVNARIMGKPDVGTIEPGKRADIIVVPGDPVYMKLRNLFTVTTVIKNGTLYKRDGKPLVPMPR